MKTIAMSCKLLAALALALVVFSACESTDGGGGGSVSGGVYYGVGFYDPWYYGHYDVDYDIDISPPDRPVRPEHPIAKPPSSSPRPTPSIPSTPRVAPRGGGRR